MGRIKQEGIKPPLRFDQRKQVIRVWRIVPCFIPLPPTLRPAMRWFCGAGWWRQFQ
jgi:hypothetical protein